MSVSDVSVLQIVSHFEGHINVQFRHTVKLSNLKCTGKENLYWKRQNAPDYTV